jgi:energy-coupling factor transporter transmembrane protein EcfT
MNSVKVKNRLGPFIVVMLFVMASFGLSEVVRERNWQSIMLITTLSFFAFYVIGSAGFSLNKARALCSILAIHIAFCLCPYVLLSWVYVNLDIARMDYLYNIIYSSFQSFSVVISVLLIIVSLPPSELFDDIARRFRIDIYLHRFNMRVGMCVFSVNPALLK